MPNLSTQQPPGDAEPRVEKQPIRVDSFEANMFFALFGDRPAAEAARQQLQDAGVAVEDVELYAGSDGAALLQPDSKPTGLLDRIVQLAQELSDFKTFVEGCSTAVEGGEALLVVRFEDEEGRSAVEATVREAGGSPQAYTDNWTLIKYS